MFAAHNAFFAGKAAVAQVSVSGSAFRASSSITTMPSHNVGDLIVMVAVRSGYAAPGKPSASGTVPAWVDIDVDNSGTQQLAFRTAYFKATATNTTSGTWSNTGFLFAVVLSGQNAVSPIGGHAVAAGPSSTTITAPSVTLASPDGSSQILHFASAAWNSAFSTAGYTALYDGYSPGYNFRAVTKNLTTSDGSMEIGTSSGSPWASATIEIKA